MNMTTLYQRYGKRCRNRERMRVSMPEFTEIAMSIGYLVGENWRISRAGGVYLFGCEILPKRKALK